MGLIRILLFVGVAFVVYTIFKRVLGGGQPRHRAGRPKRELEGQLVQDPNCKVYVDSRDAVQRTVPDGTLFFCSEACAETYLREREARQRTT